MLAFLLALIAAAPGPSFQEPVPAGEPETLWDGATEDAYRRALHLWQVRGRPAEAADILLAIADDEAVIQQPGQASWVLALAARALAEAGRAADAAALLPGAQHGARGTPFEEFVRREVEPLRQSGAGGLDERFLASLLELLNAKYVGDTAGASYSARNRQIERYGRTVLPYLLEVLGRWPSEQVQSSTVNLAINLGLSMADARFVDSLIGRARDMTTLAFLTVVPEYGLQAIDETAEAERLRFYLAFAHHSDAERVQAAKSFVGWCAFHGGDLDAIEACRTLLQDGDPRADAALLANARSELDRAQIACIRECARLPDRGLADKARTLLVANEPFLDDLREFAASGEDRDVARYLIAILRGRSPESSVQGEDGKVAGSHTFLRSSRFHELGSQVYVRSFQIPPASNALPHASFDGFAFLEPFVNDGEMRTLLALAAASVRDEEGVGLAYQGGLPADELAVLAHLHQVKFLPPAMLPRLFRIPDSASFFSIQWGLLMQQRPEQCTPGILDFAPPSRVRETAKELMMTLWSLGRLRESFAVALDPRVDRYDRVNFLQNLRSATPAWLEHLDAAMAVVLLFKEDQRGQVEDVLHDLLRNVPQTERDRLGADGVVGILAQLHGAGMPCWIGGWITSNWSGYGAAATERFAQDEAKLAWLAQGAFQEANPWPTAAGLLRYCLERGAPASWFAGAGAGLANWIPDTSEDLASVAVELLTRSEHDARRLGLQCIGRRRQDVQRFWDLVERDWSDPRLAALTAWAMREAGDRDRLVAGLTKAWSLPGVEDRGSLIVSIASVADARLAPILLGALSDADPAIATVAREGLQRLKEIEEQRAFWDAWEATGVGGSPTAALIRQIRGENKDQALYAIRALGALRDPASLPLLIELLASPDPKVAQAAREALRWLEASPAPK